MRRLGRRERWLLIIAVLLSLILCAALVFSLVEAKREEERLLRAQEEESRRAALLLAERNDPSLPGGFRLIAEGKSINVFYFGDEMIYGRGVESTLAVNATCYRTLIKEGLEARYGRAFAGYVPAVRDREGNTLPAGEGNPALSVANADFMTAQSLGVNYLLAILAPTERTAAAGAGGDSRYYTGDFAHDLEYTVRNMRQNAKNCDIVLVVPHDASEDFAATLLAVATHYGLVTVDMRPLAADAAKLTGGWPNEDGHRAYAEAILDAVASSADAGYKTPLCPPPTEQFN